MALITIQDVKGRGYDLTADGRLNQGDFETIEKAAEQFIDECCNSIWGLIEKHRGYLWTIKFKEDMQSNIDKESNEKAYYIQQGLKAALLEQVIFIYENGDANASSIKDDTRKAYSTKALSKLYNIGILNV